MRVQYHWQASKDVGTLSDWQSATASLQITRGCHKHQYGLSVLEEKPASLSDQDKSPETQISLELQNGGFRIKQRPSNLSDATQQAGNICLSCSLASEGSSSEHTYDTDTLLFPG